MPKITVKAVLVACALGVSASLCYSAEPSWPQRPVRVVVPFSAGGVADVLARVVGQRLSEKWGQPVSMENVTGAGGNIGMAEVVKGKPDGQTIVLAPGGNLTINPHYYKKLPFDVDRDFIPVTILADAQNVLVAAPKLGVTTLKGLIELGHKRPEGLSYASPGEGSTQHLAGALLQLKAQVKALHIAYRGFAPALNDVMSGEVDMMFLSVSSAAPYIKSGKLVALAIAGPERAAILPDVPSMPEVGYPDFNANSWYSFVVRSGTPDEIVKKMNKDINDVLKQERDRIIGLGLLPSGKGLRDFSALMKDESLRWKGVITSAGIVQQ
jgi:tripartite-type tricarboxylate transporter receptor subunit TctC